MNGTFIGIGVLGCANIARKNIKAISRVEGLEAVAIGSRSLEKAQMMVKGV
jgi:predicted dehydrogenase